MRHSKSYVGTYYIKSAGDMLEVEVIRKTIKTVNATARAKDRAEKQYRKWRGIDMEPGSRNLQYRVALKARGPRTKHARADGRHSRAYDQSLPLRHAERVDLYVYEQSR